MGKIATRQRRRKPSKRMAARKRRGKRIRMRRRRDLRKKRRKRRAAAKVRTSHKGRILRKTETQIQVKTCRQSRQKARIARQACRTLLPKIRIKTSQRRRQRSQ